jgi:hypothetical protein
VKHTAGLNHKSLVVIGNIMVYNSDREAGPSSPHRRPRSEVSGGWLSR